MLIRAEGLVSDCTCPGSRQGADMILLEVVQAALAPPEVWDTKTGKKHSPQLVGYSTALGGGRPHTAAVGLQLDMSWGSCHGYW